jgi:putative transposase
MEIREELLDELLKNYQSPEDILGENGLLKQLTKGVLERCLQGEMTHHLGYAKHELKGKNTGNSRNGSYKKTVTGDQGEMPVKIPRDRDGTFEPVILPKGRTRFKGFDDKIISLYARGMTTRDIQSHLEEIYGVEVSPSLISIVTDTVEEEVKAWQNRPLDAVYPIVYMDAIRVKVRHSGQIQNKAIYLALGITMEGVKEVLGMWAAETEGAKFWMQIVTELKNRGLKDIFIACVDGLKGFPEAIEAVYPETQVQLCMVHMVRHSLKYVSWKRRKEVAADLKAIYSAVTAQQASDNLQEFSRKWDMEYPTISVSWRNNWERVIPLFGYPPEIRKVIYTTNAIESLNMSLRKVTKNRGSFPNDESAFKLLYLALRNIAKKWTLPIRDWKSAMNQFAILFEGRMPLA